MGKRGGKSTPGNGGTKASNRSTKSPKPSNKASRASESDLLLEFDSIEDHDLLEFESASEMMATIKVRYLKNSVADNQVVISEYLQMGWVRPTADKNKVSPNTPDE